MHKDTKNEYDPNGFDINDMHKDTGTFLNKKNLVRNDILNNINWLKNKNEFLKLYNKIIKKGEFTGTANKKIISSKIFKDFAEDILNGKIKNNNKQEIYKKRFDNVENDLSKSKKSKNVNQLKDYLIKIKNLANINDKKEPQDARDKIKISEGKGHINLSILLSKIYTNNNSKELINYIKQLVKDLYDNKQINKQVYNILIKAITYKNDS